MDLSFPALKPDYVHDLQTVTLTRQAEADVEAKALLIHRDRFLALQKNCGVPALWVMPVFYREEPSFNTYLGNGQPLDRPTTEVPVHRGPFSTWEAGAADALALDHITLVSKRLGPWDWPIACYEWELWNGFGPREFHGRPSGYLWAGSSVYRGGKYVGDRQWSRGTWDHQLGTVVLAKSIAALDAEIAAGFAPAGLMT